MALERAGVHVSQYFASEVDKYALQVGNRLYPDTINIGDITKVHAALLGKIGLFIGGSPCQGFSAAGKQLGFNDPRSSLFFEYVRLLREVRQQNPNVKFLLENVRMKKAHLDVITQILNVEPICINSALVSAQNRVRYYWTNIPGVVQPSDRGIMLADILEEEGVGVVKDRGQLKIRNEKSRCLDANYHKGADNQRQRTLIANIMRAHPRAKKVSVDKNGIRFNRGDLKSSGLSELGRITFKNSPKTSCLMAKQIPNTVCNDFYRKLTPRECARLQTVPERHIDTMLSCGVSKSQLYKMLGNGWTIDVIAHIFRGL